MGSYGRAERLLSVLAGLVVVGCASGTELYVDQAPLGAAHLQGVRLVDEAQVSVQAEAVMSALQNHHGVTAGEAWHLEVTLAVRPVELGAATDLASRQGQWDVAPRAKGARRGPALHVLSVVARGPDAQAARMVTVSGRGPHGQTPAALLEELAVEAARLLVEGKS